MDSPESNVSPPAGNFWWLYLDESGDLGFDFVNKRPSRFFTVCILATSRPETNIRFRTAIRRTLRHKLNPKGKRKRWVEELKGAKTIFPIKQYVWKQVGDATFGIYCVTLNKKRLFPHLTEDKNRVYNYVSRLVVDQIPFEKANGKVHSSLTGARDQKRFWNSIGISLRVCRDALIPIHRLLLPMRIPDHGRACSWRICLLGVFFRNTSTRMRLGTRSSRIRFALTNNTYKTKKSEPLGTSIAVAHSTRWMKALQTSQAGFTAQEIQYDNLTRPVNIQIGGQRNRQSS